MRRGFFFWTPVLLVLAYPFGSRRADWTSEELIRRVMSALETRLDGRRKSFLRADGVVVEP